MKATNIELVLVTAPSEEIAASISHELVRRKLAACVNIIPNIRSIFSWNNAIEEGLECLLLLKTTTERYSELEAAIVELHPYEVPEVLAVNIDRGSAAYCGWVKNSTEKQAE